MFKWIKKENNKEEKEKWESRAKEYMDDKGKAKALLKNAKNKAEKSKNGPIEEFWDRLQQLFQLFKNWINGSYKEIPAASLFMLIVGLVYFVTPIDIVPDFIAGLGLFDDAAVLGLIIKQLNGDLESYKTWKNEIEGDAKSGSQIKK